MKTNTLPELVLYARWWVQEKLDEDAGPVMEIPREDLAELFDLIREIEAKVPKPEESDALSRAKSAFDDLLEATGPVNRLGNGARNKLIRADAVLTEMLAARP